jgi:hypothetical protein
MTALDTDSRQGLEETGERSGPRRSFIVNLSPFGVSLRA